MGVGVETAGRAADPPPPPGTTMVNHDPVKDSAAAASTHSPAEAEDVNGEAASAHHANHEVQNSSGLDTSKDESITVDVESMTDVAHDEKMPIPLPEERTPLNNVTNSSVLPKKEEPTEPADWSEYFLGDMPLSQWQLAVKKYVITPLIRHPRSLAFRKPVDPVALGIYPIYNQVITRPMDLGTVKTKVDKKLYNSKAAVLNDIDLVWNNAIRFNPVGHDVHNAALFLQKHTKEHCLKSMKANQGALGTPVAARKLSSSFATPVRQVGIREARKRAPVGLPGEYDDLKPQHLEQKYVSRLSEPLKACDGILRNLMLQSQHWDYVEPFMKVSKTCKMSLGIINERLRTYFYTTSMEFATDMRRIITETYRAAEDPEEDFISQKATKLQKEFERQYALVNTDNEGSVEETSRAIAMTDPYIKKLLAAQTLINNIHTDVSFLVHDYDELKPVIKAKKAAKRAKLLQNRKRAMSGPSPVKPAAKRPKPNLPPKPVTAESAVNAVSKKPPTEQIGEWISMLDDSRQESLLEILRTNGENIEVDADGSVELSLENWSQKTLDEVELFLRREIPSDDNKLRQQPVAPAAQRAEDSSSDSDTSSSDDSSSSDSSDDDDE